jgi:hypothetical protein
MIEYYLIDNPLTPAPDDYMAQMLNVRVHKLDDIFQRISARYPGLTPAQISSAVNEFFEEICAITADGETINTPLFNSHFSVSGVFDGAMDVFDPKRHSLKLHVSLGTRLREALRKVKLEKTIAAEPVPHILEVKDIQSDTVNEKLTPGGVVKLGGGRLKFLQGEENNGVFIVDENGAEKKLSTIVENNPTHIIAVMPADVAAGVYFMEVRSSFSGSDKKPSRMLKIGRFHKELIV